MTIKEIAVAVGKTERSVQLWIQKITSEKISLVSDKMSLVNSIKIKAGSKDSVNPADYDFEETLLIIEVGLGKNAAGVYRANAANRNALTAQNDISARLDRIENAIARLALGLNQHGNRFNQGSNRKLLENKHDKERIFYDFIAQNIEIAGYTRYVKRVEVWERYTGTVKKADRMVQKVFFDKLATVFPKMKIAKTRIGPFFQYFCYGIDLKSLTGQK